MTHDELIQTAEEFNKKPKGERVFYMTLKQFELILERGELVQFEFSWVVYVPMEYKK